MAQSKSFFGLRKGSTKSLTFQVLDGKQITKDRVSEVKNPKTNVQMSQRSCFATVAAAFSTLKEICNHSFETADGKTMNQAEFMRRNLSMLRKQSGNFNPNEWKHLIPNKYIVSDGSLSLSISTAVNADGGGETEDGHYYAMSQISGLEEMFELSSEEVVKFTWQQFADMAGMDAGDQLTFMQVVTDGIEYLGQGKLFSNVLNLCRIVIPTSATDLAKPMFQLSGAATDLFKIINAGETSQNLDNFRMSTASRVFGLRTSDYYGDAAVVYGAALIRSAYVNGKWKRSKAEMNYFDEVIDEDSLTMAQVLPTWNPSGELYLNNANKNYPTVWQNSVTSGGSTSGGSTSGGSTSGGSEEEGDVIL